MGRLIDPIAWAERGLVPDRVLVLGIRSLLAARLRDEARGGPAARQERFEALVEQLRASPVAVAVDAANEQHYEVPAELFEIALGPRMKYSSCLWPPGTADLAAAEDAMLAATAERAGIEDGMEVLDLGCGWGSFSVWVGERYPGCKVLAVSNSSSQRAFIEARCRERGIDGVRVVTADVNALSPPEWSERFDRVVSIEMFEHMRNWSRLVARIAGWLKPGGRLFTHVFAHRTLPYLFESGGPGPNGNGAGGSGGSGGAGDWMARRFFTGGLMPSPELVLRLAGPLAVRRQWLVGGEHYAATSRAWLANLDAGRERALAVLAATYGEAEAERWLHRWRIFFLAVAELFAYRGGEEWLVAHTLFEKAPSGRDARPAGAPPVSAESEASS